MRLIRRETHGFGPHTAIDGLLVTLGAAFLIGLISLPGISLLYGAVLAILGALTAVLPFRVARRIGSFAVLLGLYVICRHIGALSADYLQYIFACFLLIVGIINIARDFIAARDATNLEEDKLEDIN